MRWVRITLSVPSDAAEPAWPILESIGCSGVEIATTREGTDLVGYVPANDGLQEMLQSVKRRAQETCRDLGCPTDVKVAVRFVDEEDWAHSWKSFFKPFRVGRHLVVCPSWETVDLASGDRLVEIDPGMAFGSGTHESTQLSMEALEREVRPGHHVIDLGCGSGILAIAAARLGAATVEAYDNDPEAIPVARDNAERNGVAHIVRVGQADLLEAASRCVDIIVANIIAPVIARLMPMAAEYLKPGGCFIGAGIVKERLDMIENAALDVMPIVDTTHRGEWRCVVARKRTPWAV